MTPPSNAYLEQGVRWAHAFSDTPLSDKQAQAVGFSYAQHSSLRVSPVCDGELDGQPLRLVRLNHLLYAIHGTTLWVSGTTQKGMTFADLCRVHQANLSDQKALPVPYPEWLLHGFGVTARRWADACAQEDLREAFATAGLHGSIWTGANEANLLRRRKGYTHRTRYYLGRLGQALRAVRERLDPSALHTVWGIGLANGALVHWMSQGATEREQRYRRQAVGVQPYLLPLALFCSGQTPGRIGLEEDGHASEASGLEVLLRAGERLTQAIDAGQPFHGPLTQVLTVRGPRVQDVFLRVPNRHGHCSLKIIQDHPHMG